MGKVCGDETEENERMRESQGVLGRRKGEGLQKA